MTTIFYIILLAVVGALLLSLYYNRKEKLKLRLDISLRDKIEDRINTIRNTQQSNLNSTNNHTDISTTGTILILDDQGPIVFLLKQLLERHDFTVISFTDPFEAFEYLKLNKDSVDIIITDYSIPMMKGIEIVKTFKSIKSIPLIVFTGHSYITFKNEEERSMVDGVIYKPTSGDTVINKVIELLQKSKELNNEKIRTN